MQIRFFSAINGEKTLYYEGVARWTEQSIDFHTSSQEHFQFRKTNQGIEIEKQAEVSMKGFFLLNHPSVLTMQFQNQKLPIHIVTRFLTFTATQLLIEYVMLEQQTIVSQHQILIERNQ